MNLEYFAESLDSLMYVGKKLNHEQKLLIENSLILLQSENRFTAMFFWGRINGIVRDYYIAYGYTRDLLKDRKYFFSTDCYQWILLPFIQTQTIFQATLMCRDPFIGDSSAMLTIKLDPFFDVSVNHAVTTNHHEVVRMREEERLAALVFIITEESAIVPRGALYKLIDGRVIPNQMFHGLKDLQLENTTYYQLFRLPRVSCTENFAKRSDYNFAIDFLDSIDEVIPHGRAFFFNLHHHERLVTIRSCIWDGMTFFHKLNSRKHGFCYFGDGKKNNDLLFMF